MWLYFSVLKVLNLLETVVKPNKGPQIFPKVLLTFMYAAPELMIMVQVLQVPL